MREPTELCTTGLSYPLYGDVSREIVGVPGSDAEGHVAANGTAGDSRLLETEAFNERPHRVGVLAERLIPACTAMSCSRSTEAVPPVILIEPLIACAIMLYAGLPS